MTQKIQKLAQATGIPSADLLSIWDEVKANHAKLDGCARHDFGTTDERKLGARYVCRVCGGWANAIAVTWYLRGVLHGSQQP